MVPKKDGWLTISGLSSDGEEAKRKIMSQLYFRCWEAIVQLFGKDPAQWCHNDGNKADEGTTTFSKKWNAPPPCCYSSTAKTSPEMDASTSDRFIIQNI